MGTLWELWAEISQESESLTDPVLLECLEAGQAQKIFDDITDDNLKSILSLINSLLNDPKTREKGATIFNQLILSIKVKRLVGFQDTLTSTLHLICKHLGSQIGLISLGNFLPDCRELPDVNQIVTSSIISKVMSHCIEEFQNPEEHQPTSEVIELMEICLIRYRGPCGPFRDRLEKSLIPFLDHENTELTKLICDLLPLMSATGGSGSEKDKHSLDWSQMVLKLLKSSYDTLYQLYSDSCPTLEEQNPFDKGQPALNLKAILQPKVFLRTSLLKRRLVNLIAALSSYLKEPFISAKPVVSANIFKMINYIISVNPIDLLKSSQSSRKEFVFLAALLPSVHKVAFDLIGSLLFCLGSNLFTESLSLEQIFTQEWKWIDGKKNAFENLKIEMYASLYQWLRFTFGDVTSPKTQNMWMEFLSKDFKLEKDSVELKLLPKSKKEKKQFKTQALTVLSQNSTNTGFPKKNSKLCKFSLTLVQLMIHGMKNNCNAFKTVFQLLSKTHLQVYQSPTFPSPYDDFMCRVELNAALFELATNPWTHDGVGVPLGLIATLLEKSSQDPHQGVAQSAFQHLSLMERMFHPMCSSLDILESDIGSSKDKNTNTLRDVVEKERMEEETEQEEGEIETCDTACQTEKPNLEEESESEDEVDSGETSIVKKSEMKLLMEEIRGLRSSLDKSTSKPLLDSESSPPSLYLPFSTSAVSTTLFDRTANSMRRLNGFSETTEEHDDEHDSPKKRRADQESNFGMDNENELLNDAAMSTPSAKKSKEVSSSHYDSDEITSSSSKITGGIQEVGDGDGKSNYVTEEVMEMLQDFVDEGPGDGSYSIN